MAEDTHSRESAAGLNAIFMGRPIHGYSPWYLARHQRNIEINPCTTSSIDDFTSMSSGGISARTPPSSSSSPASLSSELLGQLSDVNILNKEEYTRIIRARRQTFVHTNFGNVLNDLFALLKKDAENSRICHREVTFELPEHFDIDKTERALCDYFLDCGYKPIAEARKEAVERIVITLT